MDNKKLIPNLRFPEFNNSWEEKRLEEITTKISDGIHSTPKYNNSGKYYFINGNNLVNGKIKVNSNTKKVSTNEFDKHKRDLNSNTLLLSINGTIGNLAYYNNESIILGKSASYINIEKKYPVSYYYYILQSPRIKKYFLSELTGSTIKNLSLKTIKNCRLYSPQLSEQEKIASFLTDVDSKLTQLTKKKALLENYKKGVMQKIFNQKIRFKDNKGNNFPKWEEKTLGEVLDYEQPTKYIVSSTEYQNNFKTPVLTAGKTFLLGHTNEVNNIFTNLPVIIFDDFTMANKFVDFDFKVKSSAMKILKPKSSKINLKFIYESIQLIKYPKGDEHKRFWISEYSKINIKYPCLEEQEKIANFLSEIDNKIKTLNTNIENNKVFKKGLLQKMFV
ncbi:Probable type I restriction-modification system, DNA specificity domain protein [Tenacibaculum dicentrarchi]|uniref:Probable type I restriction-modification system, DNA specificity domain protein n=1 Tax=Tenacibaculum dicentrarchi TaxID=669041 RepID=A0ABM9NUZ7_9FLAO|nr:Probable type I restriction-modification system, DNA specificity domain protein [Tenacibaculum dicentrarchi]